MSAILGVTLVLFSIARLSLSSGLLNINGELFVFSHPDSLEFVRLPPDEHRVYGREIREMVAASLGLTTNPKEIVGWFCIKNPFEPAEAVVELRFHGVERWHSIWLNQNMDEGEVPVTAYNLSIDELAPKLNTMETVRHRAARYGSTMAEHGFKTFVHVDMKNTTQIKQNPHLFGPVKHRLHKEEFQRELAALDLLFSNTADVKQDYKVDYFRFAFRSLHKIASEEPELLSESMELMHISIKKLVLRLREIYKHSFVLIGIGIDHRRRRRVARGAAKRDVQDIAHERRVSSLPSSMTLETASPDTAAVFNIIFWFGGIYVFTLLVIVQAFCNMDPGKDTIVYRMTSMRNVKKDA